MGLVSKQWLAGQWAHPKCELLVFIYDFCPSNNYRPTIKLLKFFLQPFDVRQRTATFCWRPRNRNNEIPKQPENQTQQFFSRDASNQPRKKDRKIIWIFFNYRSSSKKSKIKIKCKANFEGPWSDLKNFCFMLLRKEIKSKFPGSVSLESSFPRKKILAVRKRPRISIGDEPGTTNWCRKNGKLQQNYSDAKTATKI